MFFLGVCMYVYMCVCVCVCVCVAPSLECLCWSETEIHHPIMLPFTSLRLRCSLSPQRSPEPFPTTANEFPEPFRTIAIPSSQNPLEPHPHSRTPRVSENTKKYRQKCVSL